MAQEKIFSDFSGGMNALAAVDKLDPRECLLAENVRLDETGNVQSAGAMTRQNAIVDLAGHAVPYAAAAGTSTNNIHSLYWNPALGAVVGVGQDVFTGPTLGGMVSGLAGKNPTHQKMSFASAPGRVYFDVESNGYWSDMHSLILVDWPSPIAIGATVTGPTSLGTATQVSGGLFVNTWTNPNGITSTLSGTVASVGASNPITQYLRATMSTNSFAVSTAAVTGIAVSFTSQSSPIYYCQVQVTIMKNGVPVGSTRAWSNPADGVLQSGTLGGSTDLWGQTWTQADINSGTLGFQFVILGANGAGNASIYNAQVTIYQGVGFVAGTGAGGAITGGPYTWKVTFVAANGEESDASNESNGITLSAQQGTLTGLPLGDNRTVARNIYRKGGTLTAHYLVGTIQDNSHTTYPDNQTDLAALAQGTILAGDVPGDYPNTRLGNQVVRFPALHYDRVFWVVPGTNEIIWSKPLNGFAYPSVNFINVGDSKPVTRIVSIFGELIIIKTDSIWRLTGTDEASFDLTRTPSAVGTDESFTVTDLPDKILFANRWGLWVFNGYTSQPLTPKLDLWFKQNDRTSKSLFGVNGFHPPEVVSATVPLGFDARGNSEKYVLAYAEAGQNANNAILVFDVKHGNITKRTSGVAPLSLSIDPVTGFIYVGDNLGFVSLLDDWNGANQGGSAANFDFQTSYIDLQRGSNKSLWAIELYLNTNGQSLTPTVYYDNGAATEALPALTASGLQRIVRPVQNATARKMQNFSVRLNGSLTAINASGTPGVQIVHIKALYDIRSGRARTGQ